MLGQQQVQDNCKADVPNINFWEKEQNFQVFENDQNVCGLGRVYLYWNSLIACEEEAFVLRSFIIEHAARRYYFLIELTEQLQHSTFWF